MQKNKETSKRRRDVATLVAEIHGVTADHVRKVIRGDRENEEILTTYMEIIERDSQLLIAVKKAVPFDTDESKINKPIPIPKRLLPVIKPDNSSK